MGKNDDGLPTLGEAWQMLGQRLGLSVQQPDEHTVHAEGTVRGRRVVADITSHQPKMKAFLMQFRPPQRQRKERITWNSSLTVSCANPGGLTGFVESVVDIKDPRWDPRNFDPLHCRVVRGEPAALADRVLTPSVRERLMQWVTDARVEVRADHLFLGGEKSTRLDGGYIAGTAMHMYVGSPPPAPERALAGPPWWIDLMCDMADALDAA